MLFQRQIPNLFLSSCLFLTACGGGSDNTPETSVNPPVVDTTPEETPSDSWALKAQLPGTFGERWDSVVGLALEQQAPILDVTTIAFDVKADSPQGYWVYLRDSDGNDIGAQYNTSASTQWQTINLNPTDFEYSSEANIASVQFFIGAIAEDSASNNAFYFDNIRVITADTELQGERGLTDEAATGWSDIGFGSTNSTVYRDPSTVVAPPPAMVAYEIEYQRTSGIDYYVSPTGDDNHDGLSEATPLKSPQIAADMLTGGDRLLFMPGEYDSPDWDALVNVSAVGQADNWISLEPHLPDTVTFNIKGSIGVEIDGGAYVRVKGLTMKGIADSLTPAEAESKRKENWYQTGLVGNGVGTESLKLADGSYQFPHHIIVEENVISWMSGGCIGIKRADYILIRNNQVHHCGLYNVWAQSGISVWENHNFDDNTATYRTVITGNISYSNYNHLKFYASSDPKIADSYTDGNGIIIDALAIDQGYLNDGTGGVYNGRTLVENNIVYNNGGKGVNIYASDNVDVIHNTSYKNGQHPEIPGEFSLGNTKNVRVFNNIFYAADSEPMIYSYQTQNIKIRNNVMFKNVDFTDDDNMSLVIDYLAVDPALSSPENSDYTVSSDSVVIDAGTSELLSFEDINGAARPQGVRVDIGPHEQ